MRHLLVFFSVFLTSIAEEVYDVRIHEGAEKGTRLTLGVAMQRKMEGLRSCYGQLDTDIPWIEFKSARNAFYTTAPVTEHRNGPDLLGTLHLLCAGNKMHSLEFHVHVSHRNHYPPTFGRSSYIFYVPIALSVGAEVAKLDVSDQDPVIYNSERQLSFTQPQALFNVAADGKITLAQGLSTVDPYRPIRMQVLAIDYGSPQLHTLANVTIVPVTISEVRELHVNVATPEYQIFEWERPLFGHADRFRLSVRKGETPVHEEEIDGKRTDALTKIPVSPAGNFSYRVVAIDVHGSTPSEWKSFQLFHNGLDCPGDCGRGGIPLCRYGSFGRAEQYVGPSGPHCVCFPGFHGVSCDSVAQCFSEKTVDGYGGLDWPETESNVTLKVNCPYNHPKENQILERQCVWDKNSQRALWARAKEHEKCKLQSSVLTHLGMLGTFAGNANSVSTVHTVSRFVRELLGVPAFSRNETSLAHFDQKIAENVARVLETILAMDIDGLQGNSTLAKNDLWSSVAEMGRRLPSPFTVAAPDHGLIFKTVLWNKFQEPVDTAVGTRCRINLPKVEPNQVLRTICMMNATLFDIVDQTSPVLSLESDSEETIHFSRITLLLKPKDQIENYTCVFYDESENGWSTKGIRRVDANYHGFVRCESTHLGVFSLLPERFFHSEQDYLRDLATLIPGVTTVISLVISLGVLFIAAVQRNQSVDFALLAFLFVVFALHIAHLVMLIAPQVGDPFDVAPVLQLSVQFCILSLSASLFLVISSLRDVINPPDRSKDEDPCCGKGCSVFMLSFVLPALLTSTTFYFSPDYHDFDRLFERVDWLFLANYLFPSVFFLSLAIVYAAWNVCSGSNNRIRNRGSSDRYMALTPAIHASLVSIFLIILMGCVLVFFFLRGLDVQITVLLPVSQILFDISLIIFVAFVFRTRYHFERSDVSSCDSLERKRDISRALLDHVADTAKQSDAGSSGSMHSDVYLQLPHSLYDRAPMVSIV